MQNKTGWAVAMLLSVGWTSATAQTPTLQPVDYAVPVSATVQTEPPQIRLNWPAVDGATGYAVERKRRQDGTWGLPVFISSAATSYTDTEVTLGSAYEYHVRRSGTNHTAHGYIYAGIEVPLVDDRGKVILLVENTHAIALASELSRLQQDLTGDGWTVVRHDLPRMSIHPGNLDPTVWPIRSNELAAVKAVIRNEYLADRERVKAVLLFGHLPVPYSGAIAPDEHPDHRGAWPADVYYADMHGTWSDSTVENASAADPRNRNVPGDGKFDPSATTATVALEVGRVDLANMPTFPMTEQELLRQYLEKNHQFRQKKFRVESRALIDDHLGVINSEAPATVAWMNFAPLVGPANVSEGRWLSFLPQQDYLWAYGCGPGQYTSAGGVADTVHFLVYDTKVVFTMLFGSYFGDWDSTDNLLRAPLTTTSYTLTSMWANRPNCYVHLMGLGETIGACARLTQNNVDLYIRSTQSLSFGGNHSRGVQIALMGDPTLRLHPVAPPSAVEGAENAQGGVNLSWGASADAVVGYTVYRAPSADGPYTRLTSEFVNATSYRDMAVTSDRFYMVRAVRLETSPSGTYYNASQGAFTEVALAVPPFDDRTWAPRNSKTWTINDATGGPGNSPGWDLLTTDWPIEVTATESNRFNLHFASFQSDFTPGPPANFNPDQPYSWLIVRAGGTLVGFDPAKINLVTSDFRADLKGGTFSLEISTDRRSLVLVFTPNRPPTAIPITLRRAPGATVRIDLADLLSQSTSDPDGDSRALLQVAPAPTASALTVSTDENAITVSGGTNFFERLIYTVQDVRPYRSGDTPRTGSATITLETILTDGDLAAVQSAAYHAIEVEWQSEEGKLYQLQSRSDTESQWTNQGAPIIGTGAHMSIFERANSVTKFYRIIGVEQTSPPPTEGPIEPEGTVQPASR